MPRLTAPFTALPGDPSDDPRPRQVLGALWSKVAPTPVAEPRLVAHSPEVAELLGLSPETLQSEAFVAMLAGNRLPDGAVPYAANYGGHQFGHWAGQLGDGRAISLGELRAPSGASYELQLKGAGRTPYSRRGDGRAVLRSSVREFLCSEAMHHLGVPTTRALALVRTGEEVVRDMFYDGRPAYEPGAIVCRVAPSFVRFGSFELLASRKESALLRQLADYTLTRFYPELGPPTPESIRDMYFEVAERTARLVAHWQAVGFVHGVLNTDNLSILGDTIDYGPYGWLEDYDPGWTPNTTDAQTRRYRFGNQPHIGLWNVERLGAALLPLLEDVEVVREGCRRYEATFTDEAKRRYAAKLGLAALEDPSDEELVQACFDWLAAEETDMTIFFRGLSRVALLEAAPTELPAPIREAAYGPISAERAEAGVAWLRRWWERVRRDGEPAEAVAARMDAVNPKYVLRNWLAQQAIDAAHEGDDSELLTLLDVMRRPFDEQPGREAYAAKRPEWARHRPGCSALSCSS